MMVFTFLFALIFMAMLLAYGMKTLVRLKDTSEHVEVADFILKLQDYVTMMYSFDPGSTQDIKLFIPKAVERICFYDQEQAITIQNLDPDLKLRLETKINDNVFIDPASFPTSSFPIEHLHVLDQHNPLCFAPQGTILLRLETVIGEDGKVFRPA